ncbi:MULTISPECIES: TIGR04351 family putative TOMM peptide [Kitasatospora]|uniref:TIGR04351 family putative TOMM peptide n=1 Tax=Kitasatospora TaxID=2063 RepID=UPI0002F466A3|nr:TIGR04351 family putative TOMM peptide [Kitasatospora setae]
MLATVPRPIPSTRHLESDWRFAELVVRTHLEPGLRLRYLEEPAEVLAEFGLSLPEGATAPVLPGGGARSENPWADACPTALSFTIEGN